MPAPNYFDMRRCRAEVPLQFYGYPLIVGRDEYIAKLLKPCNAVLEIGAGDRPFFGAGFERPKIFRMMDIDRALALDFYSIEEVTGNYDAVLMREVVEHLPRPMFYEYLDKIKVVLNSGGKLLLTTPNTWAPSWVLADYTHVSAWPMHDMYGVLRCFGFQTIQIYRIEWPSRILPLKRLLWSVLDRVHLYPYDHAGSYLAIATKP